MLSPFNSLLDGVEAVLLQPFQRPDALKQQPSAPTIHACCCLKHHALQVVIEIAIGAGAQLIAEIQQRGPNFRAEMDFVVAGLVTCVLANFFAVSLSAPTIIPKAAVCALQHTSCVLA
jgi:hypothetical protein